ncbi:MAG: DUF2093 domain-containing protein [Hyphomicrobiales bacterium]
MNRFEPKFTAGQEARLTYQASEYHIDKPGDFVRCAVTGKPIPLELLRDWSVERQEPYASIDVALERHLKDQ